MEGPLIWRVMPRKAARPASILDLATDTDAVGGRGGGGASGAADHSGGPPGDEAASTLAAQQTASMPIPSPTTGIGTRSAVLSLVQAAKAAAPQPLSSAAERYLSAPHGRGAELLARTLDHTIGSANLLLQPNIGGGGQLRG
jgi:hypothetical protein